MSARLWSKKANRKVIDMDAFIPIDDLLKMVAPSLISRYEKNVLAPLGMGTLSQLNEEHKNVVDSLKKKTKKYSIAYGIILTFMILTIILFISIEDFPRKFWILAAISSVVCASLIFLNLCFNSQMKKMLGRIYRLKAVLNEFRLTIEKLDSPVGRTMHEYTEASIRDNFLTYTVQIVDAERKLDKVRLQKDRRIFDMSHLCNWIEKRQSELMSAEMAAKLLDLEFDKRTLFREAESHLDRPLIF